MLPARRRPRAGDHAGIMALHYCESGSGCDEGREDADQTGTRIRAASESDQADLPSEQRLPQLTVYYHLGVPACLEKPMIIDLLP